MKKASAKLLPSSTTYIANGVRTQAMLSAPSINTEQEEPMPAHEPEQIHRLFEQAFHAADLEGLMALYEPEATLVPRPGQVVEGSTAIRESLQWFLDRKGQITLDTKLALRVGDLAFLSNRWSLTGGTMPDGAPAELGATTAEVARQQPDGTWLYVIDNAWGDQATAA